MDALVQRLDRLEREGWWWKVIGITAMGFLGLVFLVGAEGSKEAKVIKVRRVEVVDKKGVERGYFGIDPLSDLAGIEWMGLTLQDEKGYSIASLSLDGNNSPSLYLNSGPSLGFRVIVEKGFPRMTLIYGDGAEAILDVHDGTPRLVIKDSNGASAVLGSTELEVTRTGELRKRPASSLVLFDKDGKVICWAP